MFVNSIGVSPIGWTNDAIASLGGNIPLEKFLQDAREIGFEGVELGRKFPRDAETLKRVLEPFSLRLVSGWHSGKLSERSVADELAAAESHLALLSAMGSGVVVYGEVGRTPADPPPMARRPRLADNEWTEYGRRLTDFARRVRDKGLRLAFHVHVATIVETRSELIRLLAETGPEVGLVYDSGHARLAGDDPLEVLHTSLPRLAHVHLKDVRPAVAARARSMEMSLNDAVIAGVFTTPGDGAIDFGPIIRTLKAARYPDWLVIEAEQDPEKADPHQYSARAYRYIQELMAPGK
jgi:inosose dehydratase